MLNLAGDPAKYGKEIGGDLLEGKRTMIVLRWLEDAPEEQRHIFLQQMRRGRTDKDEAVIADIHAWLLASGSVTQAQDCAHAQAARGLALLEDAFRHAADPQAARELLTVIRALATREA